MAQHLMLKPSADETVLHALLVGRDFGRDSLGAWLVERGKKGVSALSKQRRAEALALDLVKQQRWKNEVLDRWVEQRRTCLAIYRISARSSRQGRMRDNRALVSNFGVADGWYSGTRQGGSRGGAFVYSKTLKVLRRLGGEPSLANARWHMFAFQDVHSVTFEWDRAQAASGESFDVDREVLSAIREWQAKTGLVLEAPDLREICTGGLRSNALASAHGWKDIEILSRLDGATVHAIDSYSIDDLPRQDGEPAMEMSRLQSMMRAFADAALESAGVNATNAQLDIAAAAVLRSLLREWDTKRFGFSYSPPDSQRLPPFKGRIFFGGETAVKGSHQWIWCHPDTGGAAGGGHFFKQALQL